jgi:hypothetical protein
MGTIIATCRKTINAARLVWRQNQHLSFLRTTAGLEPSREKVFANSVQTKKAINGKKGTEMNTTHTNEPTGQSAKQVVIQLGGEVLLRDYFAAKAMHALITRIAMSGVEVTERAYFIADAMLKAREGK